MGDYLLLVVVIVHLKETYLVYVNHCWLSSGSTLYSLYTKEWRQVVKGKGGGSVLTEHGGF
jgi:hypothetical protein